MFFLNRTHLILGALLLAIPALAQIPPQAGRNPNTVPPPGAGARPFTRPGAPGAMPASPAAARPSGAAPGAAGGNAAAGGEKQAIKVEDAISDEGVELQFPNTPISEILLLYEDLTGLKIIRDANAEQATVSIETTGTLPKEKAILFIEKSLLLNGYAFAPAGEGMVKFLAVDAKKPITEGGAPLIESAMELPVTDQVVNFVILLKYLNAEDAKKAIEEVVNPLHSYGKIIPIPNAKALVITENSNTIRSIVTLMERLDHKPAETIQKTFQLSRSDAEDVKTALDEILGNEEKGSSGSGRTPSIPQNTPGAMPVQPTMPVNQNISASPTGGTASEAAPPKIISIARRNCLLVIGSNEQVEYIGKLIEELDAASELRNFISRPLKYLAVDAAMQVISDAITRTEGDGEGGSSGGANGGTGTNNQNNSQNRSNNNNSSSLFNNNNSLSNNGMNSGFGSSSGGLGGSSGGFGGSGGNLQPMRQNNGPASMLIGKTLLISDPVANTIFISGPPEHLRIMSEIMDELDHQPQQIIISALIGDYQMSEGRGFSLETAFRGRRTNGSMGFFGQAGASNGLPTSSSTSGTTTTTNVFDPRDAIGAAAALASGQGLSFFGGVHTGLDVITQMLESDSNFKVISRPTVFTQNNTPATLTSGLSFPIASSTQSSLVNGANSNSFLSNVQYQDIVLSLNIIPLINSADELTLQVSQQNSERAGNTSIAGNNYPIISKQELNTIISCRNRSTVLLGGLVRTDENRTRTGVPIISAIPGFNKIFGSRSKDTSNRELLIFIQPRIVEGMNDLPPSISDSVGASPFSDEAQASFNRERNIAAEARIPVAKPKFSQRLKNALNRILVND
jgi:general secretion pathway protein D